MWGWEDAALLAGAFLPAFGVGLGLMRLLRGLAPGWFKLAAVNNLTFQFLVYLLMVGALYLVISLKYGQPFWTALGWTLEFRGAILSLLAGPVLAVGVSTLGVAIRTPEVRDFILRCQTDPSLLLHANETWAMQDTGSSVAA